MDLIIREVVQLKQEYENLKSTYTEMIENELKQYEDLKKVSVFDSTTNVEKSKEEISAEIILNISGMKFSTTLNTIFKHKDSLFYQAYIKNLFKGNLLYIDRNPFYFDKILDYMRFGKIDLEILSNVELVRIEKECFFYNLKELNDILMTKINQKCIVNLLSVEICNPCIIYNRQIGDNKVQSICDNSEKTGVCSSGPGFITVNFLPSNVDCIFISPYEGCLDLDQDNIDKIVIYSSDKNLSTWTEVGYLILKKRGEQIIRLKNTTCTHLKFQSNKNFGIGTLKVFQNYFE